MAGGNTGGSCIRRPASKSYKSLNLLQSRRQSRPSQRHRAPWRLVLSKGLRLWEWWAEHTFRRRGGSEELPIAQRATRGQAPSEASPNIPSLLSSSDDPICPPLSQCALSGQQGVLLAWRWAHLVATCLHGTQIPQQQYRHVQEKTQVKTMISKFSDNYFHQESHDLNY